MILDLSNRIYWNAVALPIFLIFKRVSCVLTVATFVFNLFFLCFLSFLKN